MTDVIFKGPYCKLKGKFYQDQNLTSPVVLILYPESKTDEIPESVNSVASLMKENGFSVFLFNFSRIENDVKIELDQSQKKEQELFEVISVLNWLNEKYYDGKILWLFSFFSTCSVGLQVVMRRPEITDYILFSPPAKMKDFTFVVPCSSTGLIVYEENIPNSVEEITEKLSSKSDSHIETIPLEDVNISKNENIDKLIELLGEYIKKRLSEDSGRIKKIKRDRRRRKKKKNPIEEEKSVHVVPIKSLDFD